MDHTGMYNTDKWEGICNSGGPTGLGLIGLGVLHRQQERQLRVFENASRTFQTRIGPKTQMPSLVASSPRATLHPTTTNIGVCSKMVGFLSATQMDCRLEWTSQPPTT